MRSKPGEAGDRLRPLRTGDGSEIVALAFSPDGATLVSAGEDHLVRRWDIPRREQRGASLPVHGVKSVALGPASSVLAAIGDGHGVRLWDASTGRELRQGPRYLGPPRRSWRLGLSSGGNVMAMVGGAQTVLWDTARHRRLGVLRSDARPRAGARP